MYRVPEWTQIALPVRLAVTMVWITRVFSQNVFWLENRLYPVFIIFSISNVFVLKKSTFFIITRPYGLLKPVWLDWNPKFGQDRPLWLLNCRSREYRRVHRSASMLASPHHPFLILFNFFQALFSLVAWPFSLKIIWAPLVDALYLQTVGRRKSWLIPVQCLMGKLWLEIPLYQTKRFSINNITSIHCVCTVRV